MDRSADKPNIEKSGGFRLMSPVLRVVLLAGVLIHLAGFLVFRVESNLLPKRDQSASLIRYLSPSSIAGDLALEEQAQLFDSAPLFIPTRWNAAQSVSLSTGRRNLERFPDFEPEIDLGAALKSSRFPIETHVPVREPANLLDSRFWSFFDSFGQVEEAVVRFPDLGHFAEVFVVGKEAESFTIDSPLEFTDTGAVPEPVRLYMRVSSSGLIMGEAVIAKPSGNSAFDLATKEWLSSPQVLGKLPVGYVSVVVFP